MRNFLNKLIRDTKNPDIKFFSSVELGKNFDNPHLHIQIWFHNEKQIEKIYNKVIQKFGLFSEYCKMNVSGNDCEIFNYVVKDYSKNLSDIEIDKLDEHRRAYRAVLGKNLRFKSHSKGEYTKLIYRRFYARGIRRENVDYLLDNCIVNTDCEVVDCRVILFVLLHLAQIVIKNRIKTLYDYFWLFEGIELLFFFEYWLYGFIDWQINKQKMIKIKKGRCYEIAYENVRHYKR